jgi:hypothetical protein
MLPLVKGAEGEGALRVCAREDAADSVTVQVYWCSQSGFSAPAFLAREAHFVARERGPSGQAFDVRPDGCK